MPYAEDDNDASLNVFLWDDQFNARVPMHVWLGWMVSLNPARIQYGDEWFVDRSRSRRGADVFFTPPTDPCPGFVTAWPLGVLNYKIGRPPM